MIQLSRWGVLRGWRLEENHNQDGGGSFAASLLLCLFCKVAASKHHNRDLDGWTKFFLEPVGATDSITVLKQIGGAAFMAENTSITTTAKDGRSAAAAVVAGTGSAIAASGPAAGKSAAHKLFAAGGMLGAIAATSCCILPLILTVLGVSGAWMANLRALAPYQPYFIATTLIFLAGGFYLVYWPAKTACADGAACARPLPNILVKGALWLATVIVFAAITFAHWFPYILPLLP